MKTFKIHTIESAPEASKAELEGSKKAFGSIPNLHGVLAESPGLLTAYKSIHNLFANSSLNNEEITVVWQTINVEHACHYCVPAHSMIADSMKIDPAITEALRNETPLESPKLEVLRSTTLSMIRNRGMLSEEELTAFFEAGYSQRNLLDIILGMSQKVISNYTNHLANTPMDSYIEKYAWQNETVA